MALSLPMLQSAETGGSNRWITPSEIFDPLHRIFGFSLDACASPGDERVPNFLSPEDDALGVDDWARYAAVEGRPPGAIWCNPPYGRELPEWIRKCRNEGQSITVVLLLFATTDTDAWHEWIVPWAAEVLFLRGRIHFIAGEDIYKVGRDGSRIVSIPKGGRGPATKGSAVVVFRPGCRGPPEVLWGRLAEMKRGEGVRWE